MPNRLKDATSPYLRQHADNPVDWEEWGERAFGRARAENKPIFLSVGYAACHWCHVMAHESFENEAIARQINEGFVAIKVDREERPDIDQIYQHAIQILGVGGGWPLTAFLTPEGKPFFGGTYFPPEEKYGRPGLPNVLAQVAESWKAEREAVDGQANELLQAVQTVEAVLPEPTSLVGDVVGKAANLLIRHVDPHNGGLGSAPKFPQTSVFELLLRHAGNARVEAHRQATLFTLGKMAEGGIWDHIGGGFHRYSVDERWHVPHFEKMLYDNALLARLYVLGWQVSGVPWCRSIASETLEYLLREMRDPGGAFYASTDADSGPPADPSAHPEEGEFFAWRQDEVRAVLEENDALVWELRYAITAPGNWEDGKSVLHLVRSEEDVASETKRSVDEVREVLEKGRIALYLARGKRPRPFRDEKLLASWNGLAISAFALAGGAFGRPDFVAAGEGAADFFFAKGFEGKRLLRTPRAEGHPAILGTLDDYAALAAGCIDLWTATLSSKWLDRAVELADAAAGLFLGESGELFLTGSDAETLVQRPLSLQDQSIPAGSGMMVSVWLKLARLVGRDDLERTARRTLNRYRAHLAQQPFGFATMLNAWDDADHPVDVVLAGPVSGPEAEALLAKIRGRFIPALALHLAPALVGIQARSPLAEGKTPLGGKPTVYVCRDRTCSAPVTEVAALEGLL